MTAIDRHSTPHDPLHDPSPAPETDTVARRLRRRHWTVLALAVLLLAGVLGTACHLTVLTPIMTATSMETATADPWGPQLPRPSLPVVQSQRLARLLRLEPPHKEEPAETSVPAGPTRVDPAVRLLVDQGWPGRRLAVIPATTRTAAIGTAKITPSPQLTSAQPVPAQLTVETKPASP